jgi:hypothetical protein
MAEGQWEGWSHPDILPTHWLVERQRHREWGERQKHRQTQRNLGAIAFIGVQGNTQAGFPRGVLVRFRASWHKFQEVSR